jgi:glycosyltransferase involved in cell wall biosynthesis
MVNQHQILALGRCSSLQLHHKDMPFFMPNWNAKSNDAGFSEADTNFIAGLQDIRDGQPDFSYRISAPIPAPSLSDVPTLTHIVTEFGLDASSFSSSGAVLSDYTGDRNLVVTPSRWSRDRLLDYGFPEEGVRVVAHGVDHNIFKPMPVDTRAQIRKEFGFKPDETVFLNVGAPIWNKGMDLLLEAYGYIHQKNPRTKLIIKDGSALYGLSMDSTLKDFYTRHPALATESLIASIMLVSSNLSQLQLSQLYGMCDHYVSPYRAEGFNLPVLEAMACGVPVIVTSGGPTDDFCNGQAVSRIPSAFRRGPLRSDRDSCWLEPNVPALVDLMFSAIESRSNQAELIKAAVNQSTSYTWDRVAYHLLELFGAGEHRGIIEEKNASLQGALTSSEPSRSFHIYCDGGFGNRFNGLISGLLLAEAAGIKPVVVWPRNNWCGAAFKDIFENNFEIIERELSTYAPEKNNYHFLMTEDHLGMAVQYKSPLNLSTLGEATSYLTTNNRDVYFHTPLIPSYLPLSLVLEKIKEVKIQPYILNQAKDFIAANDLLDFCGLHIRKTDFGSNSVDDNMFYDVVNNSRGSKYFVCSDDEQVEARFKLLPNVFVYPKKSYVSKKIEGEWNDITLDHSGRAYPCNVERSTQSVIDAVVDWLILSESNIITSSASTFLRSAILRKKSLS